MSGEVVNLEKLNNNKYLLLEFWASWCLPCRKSNPDLILLHRKYSSDGFEILGIADDLNTKDKWVRAVYQDSIGHWPQILRNGFNESDKESSIDILDLYFIKYLPTRILINKEGRIIARYPTDSIDALSKDLNTIFGK